VDWRLDPAEIDRRAGERVDDGAWEEVEMQVGAMRVGGRLPPQKSGFEVDFVARCPGRQTMLMRAAADVWDRAVWAQSMATEVLLSLQSPTVDPTSA